jgi:hypothetical protein
MNEELKRLADRLALLERDLLNTKEFLLKDAALRAQQVEEIAQRVTKLERGGK